jgi:hypothetical protein
LLIIVFCASSQTAMPAPSSDEDDVREATWFPTRVALESVTHPGEHRRLEDALRGDAETIYRVEP